MQQAGGITPLLSFRKNIKNWVYLFGIAPIVKIITPTN